MSGSKLLTWVLFAGFLLPGCGEKLTEEQTFAKARESERNADYARAEKYYSRLIREFPKSMRLEEAREKQELLASAGKLDQQELLAAIAKQEAREEFGNALILMNTMLARFPKYDKRDELLQKIGLIYLNNQEQYEQSVAAYQRLLKEAPESQYAPQAQFMVGYIYANHLNQLDLAREAYTAFQAKYPTHELITSVNWELAHLGQDISSIDIFANPEEGQGAAREQASPAPSSSAAGAKQ